MNPDYVLPIFLGACVVGLMWWNVVMTGTIRDLKADLDKSEEDNDWLRATRDEYLEKLTVAVQKIPKRGPKGKFAPKA